ncbi:MAG: metal ABC transporter ATP-binding protein [Gloeomargaritaceae cyanobacterium C42_A2020_066]|nr:metal ABC transporter ATP-binding protein [Gloeomargaritaceae cyanobacterium C42_A2020_066]
MLEVCQLSVQYRGLLALENVSLRLGDGELVGLIGPNGAGKSTLLKALLGLIPIAAGRVLFRGRPLPRQRQQVAYMPQRSQIDWDYPITAGRVVMLGRTTAMGWFGKPTAQDQQRVQDALEQVGMWAYRHRPINELSGGQQQRIFLARALAQGADLIFLDEPFAGVDKPTEALLLQVFMTLKSLGKTLLVCSHEWGPVLTQYDRLLVLNRRVIADAPPHQAMTLENIQRAYGESLGAILADPHTPFLAC